jgi:hypothetical protein
MFIGLVANECKFEGVGVWVEEAKWLPNFKCPKRLVMDDDEEELEDVRFSLMRVWV